jgi:glycosyltransferase involved in cell wall biosynthesis
LKILIIGAEPFSLIQFRGDLIKELIARDFEVIVMANNATPNQISELADYGARYVNYFVSRSSINPFTDIKTLASLLKHFYSEKPDYVLGYTIKPVIWGNIASMFFPKLKFISMITGLGFAFGSNKGIFRLFIKFMASSLYKIALSQSIAVIFQNKDDRQSFIDQNLIRDNKTHVVQGSGVNLNKFSFTSFKVKGDNLSFLMVSRLLGEKGVREFIEAAKIIKSTHKSAEFILIGPVDSSPDGIPLSEVLEHDKAGIICYKGEVSDVRPFMAECSVFVLPSYHEGMPRAVLEAMAIGRPIITTNAPGCRETVTPGINGFLINKCDIDDLVKKMIWFIDSPGKIKEMGQHSRDMVAKRFDVNHVNNDIINIISNN